MDAGRVCAVQVTPSGEVAAAVEDEPLCGLPATMQKTVPFQETAFQFDDDGRFVRVVHVTPSGDVATWVVPNEIATNVVPFQATAHHRADAEIVLAVQVIPSGDVATVGIPSPPTATNTVPFQAMPLHLFDDESVRCVQVTPSRAVAAMDDAVPLNTLPETAQKTVPFHATALQRALAGSVIAVHVEPVGEYPPAVSAPSPPPETATNRLPTGVMELFGCVARIAANIRCSCCQRASPRPPIRRWLNTRSRRPRTDQCS